MNADTLHEDFLRNSDEPRSSERNLGITFAVVFALIGGIKLYDGKVSGLVWIAFAALFLLLAFFWVAPLRPLNVAWHRFGMILFRIVNPVIMAIVFYLTVLPIGIIRRLVGSDPLRLALDPAAKSYWQERRPPGPSGDAMRNQF
jgi:hypothetical protein